MSLDEKNLYPIGGQGGSGGGSTPSEDPDTLQSHTFVSVLDLLGEGQIGGLVGANTVEKEKSIYIDGTPMRTNGGTENFKGVSWAERTGTQDQSYIDGYGSIETPTSVNVQLKFNVPKVISVTNSRVDEVRIILAVGGLMVTESDGDIRGSSVNFSIGMATNSGASSEVAARTIKGKASSRYQVAYTVKLPKVANDGTPITRWDIQVTRTTPDSTKTGTQNDLYFDSYSEVITKKLTYPNSALVATRVNSEHFSSMPKREYLVDGLLIKVPSNYNHVTREYTGIWDGSFKLAPSNNPAWIMFDILTNNRYGLGEYIDAGLVDEARLYQIGRYCDQMVDDGFGNMEPRYTINCTINSRAEAYDLIADICSAFNGMSYWAGGQVGFTIDAPSDPVMAFTSANIEGEFGYSGTSVKDRHSIAVVTWNDPKDDYKQAVEYVEDPDLIERYGVRKIEIQAFGCTSRAQAHRYGRWILYTEHQQSEVCSFTAGMDASTLMPGSIVQIQDEHRAGKRFGGRLVSCTATSAILDDAIDFTGFETGLKFAVMLPDGSFVEREIATKVTRTTIIGTTGKTLTATEVTWTTPLAKLPVSQAVWVISAPNLELVQARVVGVKQGVDLDKFDISVIPHNPNKYAAIEKNVMLEIPPTSILSSRNQVPPSEVRIKQEVLVHQGLSKTRLVIDWERADKAIRYLVEWKRDEDNWVRLPETANLSAEVEDVYKGTYIARVTAIGMSGARSYPQYSVSADLMGKDANIPTPALFEAHGILFGVEMSWAYPVNSKDSSHVVIEVSNTSNVADAKLLAAVPYPATTHTVTGLMGNLTQYYRIKLVDKSGNESDFTDFVSATTIEDPEILLEMLSGHVDKIVLSPEVVDQIEQATADNAQNRADILAETAARIAELQAAQNDLVAEVDARIAGDAAEETARAAAIATEVSNRAAALAAEETARNAAINAKAAEINANIATQIDAVQDGIDQEVIDRTDAVSAVRGELNTYKTSNDSAVATALQKVDAVTTAHDATVTELDALQSSFEDLSGDLSAATTDLSSFKQTVANADAALGTRIDNLTTTVNNNNTAVNGRIANVETSVTTLEGNVNTKTSQLQSSLDTTNTNVTAAQNAANAANTLAGGKGKVLFQSTAPATADRLSQNIWIDTTGSANTPKRWNGTAWVVVTDKVATDALAAANAANTAVATKADASAVNTLTTRVTTAEGTITSQGTRVTNLENSVNHAATGLATKASSAALTTLDNKVTAIDGRVTSNSSSITSLNNSLTTTNTNVTAAQTAATNAMTAAGQKGKVIFGSTAPSTADRLSQNLWIDTTGNANTPKRWNGSAWVVVTDKVATDALAAANAASSLAATKADSSALTALDSKVTTIDGKVTTNASNITTLTGRVDTVVGDLATKADASALNSLTTRVVTEEGKSTSQGNAITALQNTVNHATTGLATKASTSALTTLDNRVTSVDGRVTTNASNITSLQGRVTTVENGLETKADASALNSYYTKTAADAAIAGQVASYGASLVIGGTNLLNNTQGLSNTSDTYRGGKIFRQTRTASQSGFNDFAVNVVDLDAGDYTLSFDIKASIDVPNASSNISYFYNPNSTIKAVTSQGYTSTDADGGIEKRVTTSWQRVWITWTQSSAAASKSIIINRIYSNGSDYSVDIANVKFEKGNKATDWTPSSADVQNSINANASATDTLNTTVTNLNGTVTSQGTRLTNLENSVNSTTNGLATKASSAALDTLSNKVNHSTTGLDAIANKATALETKVNAIKVGGSNLFALKELRRYNAGTLYATTGTYFTVAGTKITGAGMASTDRIGNAIPYTEGEDLTIAFTVVSNITDANIYYRCLNASGEQTKAQTTAVATITGTRYTLTLPASSFPAGTATVNLGFGGTATNPVVKDVVVQLGNMATAWTESYRDSPDMTLYAGAQALTDLTTRVTTAEGKITSQATSITNLSTTVGNQTTSISTLTTSVNGINASHTVKINNNGYSSGFGLISTGVNGATTSAFKVDADFFVVGKSGTGIKPFIIVSSANQVIEGVTYPTAGTYINSAKIANATIGTAHINDLAVKSAKIDNLAVTTAKIDNLAVNTAKIDNLAVTTGKIGDLAVDTLKIAYGSVTSGTLIESTWNDTGHFLVAAANTKRVMSWVHMIGYTEGASKGSYCDLWLMRGGTEILHRRIYCKEKTLGRSTSYYMDIDNFAMHLDTPAETGSVNYWVKMRTYADGQAAHTAIQNAIKCNWMLLEAKR